MLYAAHLPPVTSLIKPQYILIGLLAGLAMAVPATVFVSNRHADSQPLAAPSPSPSPSPTQEPSPSPSPAKPIIVDSSLHFGSRGPEVLALEQRLSELHYLVGKVDGIFDRSTQHGVTAFQKVERLPRNGKGDTATLSRLQTAVTPAPAYSTPPFHAEVDIPRQVVFLVRGGVVAQILPTSTGSNRLFTSQGWTRRAITPNGQFKIYYKIPKMRISPLGELYKPSYFSGGIAFHGNGSVPTRPASHGCVRLPMAFADWFYDNTPIGTVVYVYGGPSGPNPQPFLDDHPATPSPSPAPSPSPSPSPSPECTGPPTATVCSKP